MSTVSKKQINDFIKSIKKSYEIKRNKVNTPELRRKLGSMLTDIGENFQDENITFDCYRLSIFNPFTKKIVNETRWKLIIWFKGREIFSMYINYQNPELCTLTGEAVFYDDTKPKCMGREIIKNLPFNEANEKIYELVEKTIEKI